MSKNIIKKLVRENLLTKIKEEETAGTKKNEKKADKTWDKMSDKEKEMVNAQSIEIANAVVPGKQLKISQVAYAAGVIDDPDDAAQRSEVTKQVKRKPDADGKVRHLSKQDADKMSKVVKNAGAYNKG